MKKKKDTLTRCFPTFCKYKDKKLNKTLQFLTSRSRCIFNHYLFCYKIFIKYKQIIFDEIYNMKKIDDITETFISSLVKYHHFHIENKNIYDLNNKIIYDHIRYKNYFVTNSNIFNLIEKTKNKLLHCEKIKLKNNKVFFENIIENIFFSFYRKNYFYIKNCLINRK